MDPKLVKLAVELYRKTQSGNKVAQRLDVSHSTAYRLLRAGGVDLPDRHGPEMQARKRKLHGQKAEQAARDYAAGMSSKELRAKYGASMWAIRTAVRGQGGEFRSRGGRYRTFSESEMGEIVALYSSGWSQAAVAAKFGASQSAISRILRAKDVVMRKKNARGSDHGMWKGGLIRSSDGYLMEMVTLDDPMRAMADRLGYAMQHRLVMARLLGRPLSRYETVHHINGDRADNRPSNLQLRFGRHGKGVKMVCANCGSAHIKYVELD
jgi:hypothetical protein